jgi:hypothetical protein
METLSQNNSQTSCRGFNQNDSTPLGVQLADIHPIKVLFVKDKLPDRIIILPAAIAPSLNMSSKALSQDSKPISVIVHKDLFTNYSYAFCMQK